MKQQLHTAGLPVSRQAYSRCYGEERAMNEPVPSSMAELWRRLASRWTPTDPYRLSAAGGSSSVNSQKK